MIIAAVALLVSAVAVVLLVELFGRLPPRKAVAPDTKVEDLKLGNDEATRNLKSQETSLIQARSRAVVVLLVAAALTTILGIRVDNSADSPSTNDEPTTEEANDDEDAAGTEVEDPFTDRPATSASLALLAVSVLLSLAVVAPLVWGYKFNVEPTKITNPPNNRSPKVALTWVCERKNGLIDRNGVRRNVLHFVLLLAFATLGAALVIVVWMVASTL